MNYPHLHLIVNHVPIFLSAFALFLVAWGLRRASREVWRLALWVALVAGLSVYPAYFTGNEAHEQVEDYPGFDHDTTHEHEDAAEYALIVMLVAAGAAGVTLYLGRGGRTEPRWARGGVVLSLAVSLATVTRTAWVGGDIRHEEIRGSMMRAPVIPPGAAPAEHRRDDGGATPAASMAPGTDSAAAAVTATDSAGAKKGKIHVHKDGKEHTH